MASYHVIGGDTKEYGPIWAEDVRTWIAEGRLNGQSLAKAEGETAWRTLASFPEFADVLKTAAPTGATPPPFNPSTAPSGAGWEAEVLARVPELKLGECLGAGWSFFGANAGFLIGAVLLTGVMNLVLAFAALYIPLLGSLVMLAFNGVVMGGFYYACLRRMRGEAVGPGEVFWGFQNAIGPLLLTGLVAGLLAEMSFCFCVLPMIYLMVAWAWALPLVADRRMSFWEAMELSRKVVTKVWFEAFVLLILAFLPMLIFQVLNLVEVVHFLLGLYDQANQNMQQFAQLIQTQGDALKTVSFKNTLIAQAILMLNLLYVPGVLMKAYENLFGRKK
ncbi:MAG TPA: GYF domain-containing protein [Verrucomicrobiae bacterium]|nr:GYF domain-containing protein [Verrucomicrobiae bacterium]